jgi:predicted flap endonuclease-1-like 5' DNA nuclease
MLAAVTLLLAAIFLIMGRIIASAPLEEWGLPVIVFALGAALLLWDYYEGRPRSAVRAYDAPDAGADLPRLTALSTPREFRAQTDTVLVGVPASVPAVPADEAAPIVGTADTGAPVRAFVSDPAEQAREHEPAQTVAEIDAAAAHDTAHVPAPEYVGETTAPTAAHADAVASDAVSAPQPFTAATVTAAPVTEVPHMTESGARENATREHPPLSALPVDASVEATDKSQPANAPETVAVLESNNAKQTTPEMTNAGAVTADMAEAVIPAVQQASQANAETSVKAVAADTPQPGADAAEAGSDAPIPAGQERIVAQHEALVTTGETRGTDTGIAPAGHDATPSVPPVQDAPPAMPPVTETAAPLDLSRTPSEKRERDNLEVLEGIGPRIAGALNAAGILTFERLASTPEAELRSILSAANVRIIGSVSASIPTWAEQASLAARGDMAALRAWQEQHRFNG